MSRAVLTTDTEWSDAEERATHREVLFRKKVDAGAAACARGDYSSALRLYAETIGLDPTNHVLYSNRSAIFCKLGRFEEALRDAQRAHELQPSWVKAFYRKGQALKCMGDNVKALLTYAEGLAEDPKNAQLLAGLVDCAMGSSMKERFSGIYEELKSLNLERSPFVIVSVVGQELLNSDLTTEAIHILESALKVGTTSLKLRQSVLSSLSSAYWKLGQLGMALKCMQQDLAVATSLGDRMGEARAHSNLGMVYISLGKESQALNHYRHQLALSLKMGDEKSAAGVLSTLGQIYLRLMDLENALVSHQQCLEILKNLPVEESGGPLELGRQLFGMGQVYTARKETEAAEECFKEHLSLAKRQGERSEEGRALSALASLYLRQSKTEQAMRCLMDGLRCARDSKDRHLEAQIAGQLSVAFRNSGNNDKGKMWAEKQLQISLGVKDRSGECGALGNLGLVFQAWGNLDNAKRLHLRQLQLAQELKDKRAMAQAFRNVGTCLSGMGKVEESLESHKSEVNLWREVGDGAMEGAAHGSLAALYSKMDRRQQALTHLQCHWNLAKEWKDVEGESEALRSMGAFLMEEGRYEEGLTYLERFLMLAQEENNMENERKACGDLGRAHTDMEQYKEAARYFHQELALAKDLRDHGAMAQAYQALGEVHMELGQLDEAMECEKYHLALAHISSDMDGKLKAMAHIGHILLRRGNTTSATKVFGKALNLARVMKNKLGEAEAFGHLGAAYKAGGRSEKALAFLTQELALSQSSGDLLAQYTAYGHIGDHYRSEKKVGFAVKALEDQAELGRRLGCPLKEAEALAKIALTCVDSGLYEDGMKSLEEEWKVLERSRGKKGGWKGRRLGLEALWHLAQCQERMSLALPALKAYQRFLDEALEEDTFLSDDSKVWGARRKLGDLWLKLGNHERARERVEQAMEEMEGGVVDAEVKSSTLRALAASFCAGGKRRRALEILLERLEFLRRVGQTAQEGAALSDLGSVHRLVDEVEVAGSVFEKDLELSKRLRDTPGQCRALRELGRTEERVGNFAGALQYYTWMLEAASSAGPGSTVALARMDAHKLLGVSCLAMGDANGAVSHLEQALGLSASLNRSDTESEIRFAKSVLHWSLGNSQESMREIESSVRLAEKANGSAVWGDFLQSGFRQPILEMAFALQMCLLAEQQKASEALVCAEKVRYWQYAGMVERSGAEIKKHKNHVPTLQKLNEALSRVVSGGEVLLYFFEIANRFLFAWLVRNNEVKMIITRLDSESERRSGEEGGGVWRALEWRLDSVALERVVENRLAQVVAARHSPPHLCLPELERLAAISLRPFKTELTEEARAAPDSCLRLVTVGLARETEEISFEKLVSVLHLRCTARRLPALFLPKIKETGGSLAACVPSGAFLGVVEGGVRAEDECLADILGAGPVCLQEAGLKAFLKGLKGARVAHLSLGGGRRGVKELLSRLEDLNMTSCQIVSLSGESLGSLLDLGTLLMVCGAKTVLISKGGKEELLGDVWGGVMKGGWVLKGVEESEAQESLVLLGEDWKMGRGSSEIGASLRSLLKTPEECRQAFRVIVHLVEKSLQRMSAGQDHAMFTSEESVRKKMGPEACGWRELLFALGFTIQVNGSGGVDSCLYFPMEDREGSLTRGSRVLQAFDGLPQNSLHAFSQLIHADLGDIKKLTLLLERLWQQLCKMTVSQWETYIPLALYYIPGVQGLIASLGLDKLNEDSSMVTVKTIRMELTRKKVELANTCLHALFDDLLSKWMSSPGSPPGGTDSEWDVYGPVSETTATSEGIRRELSRLRDLEITDLSGMDSDFYQEGPSPYKDLVSRPFGAGKGGRRRGRRRGPDTGYASESDVKRGRRKLEVRGYHSEDEGRREDQEVYGMSQETMESTARVISVEERNSPLSDLGDSFHEDQGIHLPSISSTDILTKDTTSPKPPQPLTALGAHEYSRLETPAIPKWNSHHYPPPPYRVPSYAQGVAPSKRGTYGPWDTSDSAAEMRNAAAKVLSPTRKPPPYVYNGRPFLESQRPDGAKEGNYMIPKRLSSPESPGTHQPPVPGGRMAFLDRSLRDDRQPPSLI